MRPFGTGVKLESEHSAPLAVQMRGVAKVFSGHMALKGVELEVGRGRVHALLGPNGAGKSTAINIIAGLTPPTRGEVFILGQDALKNPRWARKKIGLLPEVPPLYGHMRVELYLRFVQQINDWYGQAAGEWREQTLKRCGLWGVRRRLVGNLSKGMRQRVGIAQALSIRPEVIILDEPGAHLDPRSTVEMRELILGLKGDHTVLLSTHHLDEAAKVCDEVSFIREGRIVESAPWPTLRKRSASLEDVFRQVAF